MFYSGKNLAEQRNKTDFRWRIPEGSRPQDLHEDLSQGSNLIIKILF